jgi:hypothetical protein
MFPMKNDDKINKPRFMQLLEKAAIPLDVRIAVLDQAEKQSKR